MDELSETSEPRQTEQLGTKVRHARPKVAGQQELPAARPEDRLDQARMAEVRGHENGSLSVRERVVEVLEPMHFDLSAPRKAADLRPDPGEARAAAKLEVPSCHSRKLGGAGGLSEVPLECRRCVSPEWRCERVERTSKRGEPEQKRDGGTGVQELRRRPDGDPVKIGRLDGLGRRRGARRPCEEPGAIVARGRAARRSGRRGRSGRLLQLLHTIRPPDVAPWRASRTSLARSQAATEVAVACRGVGVQPRHGQSARPRANEGPSPRDESETTERLRFPDFVGIGAQKAGTTWLYRNLVRHPEVWLPPVKELHYFDRLYVDTPGHQEAADEHRRKRAERALATTLTPGPDADAAALIATGSLSDDWYGSIFGLAPRDSVCGEITGSYALLPEEGVVHLVRLNPDVKILFLLRDPIERAIAHVQMLYKRGDPHAQRQFKPLRTLEVDPRVLARSRYSETLRTYRSLIDEDSLWIADFDQLATDPEALMQSVCAFLGVEFRTELFPDMHRKVHEGVPREMEPAAHDRLRTALEPEYEALAGILPEAARRWRARHYG